ncbi:unnamed protein product [Zymoseptoria tritici ST99CH_1E4]|uniref:Vacuolar fusion protein MON1 n=1 Tax=Zymoseptoria tritici ST99CH_1E4 TaxID=1276532 RepID=A0A2H1H3L0_ZYMTR|nr:unnamed protein product [Zymoseptoria tritici ST99CH_1E4]
MPGSDGPEAGSSTKNDESDEVGDSGLPPSSDIDDGMTNDDKHARQTQDSENGSAMVQSLELTPPPLPPRPPLSQAGSLRLSRKASRPQLLSTPTTAVSLAQGHMQTHSDSLDYLGSPVSKGASRRPSFAHLGRLKGNDGDDGASIRSYLPNLESHFDNESILGDVRGQEDVPRWEGGPGEAGQDDVFQSLTAEDDALSEQILHEFDEIDSENLEGKAEDVLLADWKAKLKHFFILSASGKPIYSRHGDDQLISHYIGVAQTLISFHQNSKDPLRGFTAGGTRFVMLPKGPLNLIAITRLPESDAQLRTQLESLYMQILSTLTLPSMERMFSNRPSTDLRRGLEGTEVLLDGLADGFTRGSPSTLLSALECLRLRKTHRRVINDTLLKVRSPDLLYGLVVAAGRLVSVVRPKKHSLHPGDLHLIFNMLFEAGSVKAGGGENWIPVCLPGFNNTGFLYMYVSFFDTSEQQSRPASKDNSSKASSEDTRPFTPNPSTEPSSATNHDLAVVLISANKEAFFALRKMRDDFLAALSTTPLLPVLRTAILTPSLPITTLLPNTPLLHFLYKSRGNVQFISPSFSPHFSTPVARRRLMSLYATMHDALHAKGAHAKVLHVAGQDANAVAWETPVFELYCVAGPGVGREGLVDGANRVVRWVRREEERCFIIGGAVF